jgi:DNA-binding MarR family transcriptional regulator
MNKPPPDTVPRALGYLRVALEDAFRRASREHGLTPAQAELLCAAMAPTPVGRLAWTLRCDRTNVTHLVARAAKQGWLERHCDEQDRRSSLIALTPEGAQLAERFIATLETQLQDLLATWSAQRQRSAIGLITEIATALDHHAARTPDEQPPGSRRSATPPSVNRPAQSPARPPRDRRSRAE